MCPFWACCSGEWEKGHPVFVLLRFGEEVEVGNEAECACCEPGTALAMSSAPTSIAAFLPRAQGRLVVLGGLAAFLAATLTGNVFALHAGMAGMADGGAQSAAAASGPADLTGDPPAADGPPAGGQGQHLLHVVGACMAIGAAGVILLRALAQLAGPRGSALALAQPWTAPPLSTRTRSRRAPPLKPPTSSVMRT